MLERSDLLYHDNHCLAVIKPHGLPTQGRTGATLEAWVRAYLCPNDPAGVYLGTVQRLDRPVSGVLLWALTPRAARRLADQFAQRQVRKEYWAIVAGRPESPSGIWDDWLGAVDRKTGRVAIAQSAATGFRQARTRFQVLPTSVHPSGWTRLSLHPETGRTHQLRAQTGSRGLPIVGDWVYGSTVVFDDSQAIALHARRLELEHPATHQRIQFEAPLPATWLRWTGADTNAG